MRLKRIINMMLTYSFLIIGAIIFITPFIFLITSSFKSPEQIMSVPFRWLPRPWRWQNYVEAFRVQPFGRYYLNSAIITSSNILGVLISCTLAGWGFSRKYYWGRDFFFLLILSCMMIPGQVTMIPLYIMYSKLGWINTYFPLILPSFFGSPFYIFLIRQFFLTIPDELSDAAVIDGCSPFKVFWYIGLPLVKPALVSVTIFTFLAVWNDFFTPLIYLNSPQKYTVMLGLTAYQAEGFTHWEYLMAASAVAMLPVFIVFLSLQRYFVQGMAMSGLKG